MKKQRCLITTEGKNLRDGKSSTNSSQKAWGLQQYRTLCNIQQTSSEIKKKSEKIETQSFAIWYKSIKA
jgi:hypothetical protein